jgi:hypothetical protein
MPAALPGRVGRAASGQRHYATLHNQPHGARDKPAGARHRIPAFSAIGRDLVGHRFGEIAVRARADRPALSFERRSVPELMRAMERALGLDVPQWRSPRSAPRSSRRTPGSTRAGR